MALMVRLCHTEAVFTPRTRAELQGDGTAGGGGVFGCVGACGRSLTVDGAGSTYCSNGAWFSGNGVCANADTNVPSDQGTGKYGAIGSWDISVITSLERGAWGYFIRIIISPLFLDRRNPHTPFPFFFIFSFFFLFSLFFRV